MIVFYALIIKTDNVFCFSPEKCIYIPHTAILSILTLPLYSFVGQENAVIKDLEESTITSQSKAVCFLTILIKSTRN